MKFVLGLSFIIIVSAAYAQKKQNYMEPTNQLAIINTLQGVFNSADKRDWTQCTGYFADEVFVDYSSLNNVPGSIMKATDLIKGWESFLPKFRITQHMVTNFDISIKGDKATATFYAHAIHHLPHTKGGDVWGVYAKYNTELNQTAAGWKIAAMTMHINYTEGNKNMLAAIANLPMEQKVNFDSEGEKITGTLLLPSNYQEGQRLPVIMVFGAWTQVKEQIQHLYGRKLAEQGYAVLNFDFRNWGESGGKPRFLESTNEKVKDVLNAIQFLKTHPAIDASNISLIGVCAAAGVTLRVTAQSKDIKNTATVAAWLQHPSTTPLFYGGEEGVKNRIALAEAAQKKFQQTGEVDYVEAYNPNVATSAMFFPLDYYSNSERGRVPAWDNKFAVMGWKEWMTMNSIDGIAEKINRPVIMVHSDGSALPDNVKRFYNMIPSKNKKLTWLEGEHTQFYDDDDHVDAAIAEIVSFFKAAQ
jgi:fermentation-respiration switch protein FrsA (DUF1100 family)